MELLTYVHQRAGDDWLTAPEGKKFTDLTEKLIQELTAWTDDQTLPKVLLIHTEPVFFLAGLTAALITGCPVFLGNPDWAKVEWQQVIELVQPDLVWGKDFLADGNVASTQPIDGIHKKGIRAKQNSFVNPQLRGASAAKGWIMIPTGGSSGKIRFAIHTWETLMASVQGFKQHFELPQVNSFCLLPLYHVSGLMQFLRSFTSGGKLVIAPWQAVAAATWDDFDPTNFFISLVPTQLQRLLADPKTTAWLARFQTVLLGGAPAWPQLLHQAQLAQIALAPTYGMTETASQIATLKPQDFFRGQRSSGPALPHAAIAIRTDTGAILEPNQTGTIWIQADSLALGYYPRPLREHEWLETDDLGFLDPQGHLHVVDRRSQKIITGGENVFPAEVEAAILATNLVTDICVVGLPDPDWGQVVTAVYVPSAEGLSIESLQGYLENQLSKFKLPKYWIQVPSLPRNSQGKLNRKQVCQTAMEWRQDQQNHPPGGTIE